MPTKFSNSFIKQFDLAMKLRKEELKRQGIAQTEVSEINEGDLVETIGITKNQMVRAAESSPRMRTLKNQETRHSD